MDDLQTTAPSPGGLPAALDALSLRPWLLACLALALASFAQPYAHISHDARLYSVQVLNRAENGSYAGDLFFRYGSQDSYSLFSALVAPLAALAGIPWTFFLLYLLCRTLFVLAVLRVSFVLLGRTRAAVVSTLLLSGLPLAFGMLGVFQVNEAFLTPRLPAFGLVLLGVADLLAGRPVRAALLFVLAATLHPPIAVVGFPLLAGWLVCRRWPSRGFAVFAVVLFTGEALLLGIPALARAVFGAMDAAWLENVWLFSRYNFPREWDTATWSHIGLNLGVVILAGLVHLASGPREGAVAGTTEQSNSPLTGAARPDAVAHLFGLVVLLGVAGLVATTLASIFGYRLLFQAQPYRMLWLANTLAIPALVLLVVRAWASGSELLRLAAGILAVLVVLQVRGPLVYGTAAILAPVALLLLRGRTAHWISVGVVGSLVLVIAFADVWKMRGWGRNTLEFSLRGLAVGLWVPLLLGALLLLPRLLRAGAGRLALGAVTVFLVLNGTTFALRQLPSLHGQQGPDAGFVASVVNPRHESSGLPTVFWSVDNADVIWLDLHACCYFNRLQAVGAIFQREMASEAVRRAHRVAHFEMSRLGQGEAAARLERLYGLRRREATPTREQLDLLAGDERLDFVVTDRDLGGRYLATNGRVFVYDCRQLRVERRAGSVGSTSIR